MHENFAKGNQNSCWPFAIGKSCVCERELLQLPYPNVPVAHPTVVPMVLKPDGPFAVRWIFGPTNVWDRSLDLNMVLDQDPIMDDGQCHRLHFLSLFKNRGMINNIENVPLPCGNGSHSQGNMLFVNRSYLTVHIGVVVIIVQNLHFVEVGEE